MERAILFAQLSLHWTKRFIQSYLGPFMRCQSTRSWLGYKVWVTWLVLVTAVGLASFSTGPLTLQAAIPGFFTWRGQGSKRNLQDFCRSHPSVILLAKASQKASQVLGLWSWSLSVRGVAKGCWGLHLQRLVGVWRWHSQTAFHYSFMAQSLPVLVSRQVGLVAVFPDFPASMTFSLYYSAVRTHASLPLSDVTHLLWPVENIATTLMLRFCACF